MPGNNEALPFPLPDHLPKTPKCTLQILSFAPAQIHLGPEGHLNLQVFYLLASGF